MKVTNEACVGTDLESNTGPGTDLESNIGPAIAKLAWSVHLIDAPSNGWIDFIMTFVAEKYQFLLAYICGLVPATKLFFFRTAHPA